MGIDIKTLAAARLYVKKSLQGAGAIVGKNVQVSKIEPIAGGNMVTFTYILDDGTQQNSYLKVMNGEKGDSVIAAYIDNDGILSFTLSNGETIQTGKISVDSDSVNLENYYTKEQIDQKFIPSIELDNLLSKIINENFVAISSEEIENLFKAEESK